MKRMITGIVTILSVIVIGSASAEDHTFSVAWDYPVADEANISGFRIFDSDNQIVLNGISPQARAADVTVDLEPGQCEPLYMVAYDAADQSPTSNIELACLTKTPLRAVGTITIEFQE